MLLDSVNFLNLGNEDEGFVPAGARESNKVSPILPWLGMLVRPGPGADHASHPCRPRQASKLSTSSAALDLAPLAQTNQRFPHRPFDTGLKTSEWPQFSGVPKSANDAAGSTGQTAGPGAQNGSGNASGQVSSNATGNGAATTGNTNNSNNVNVNGVAASANVSRRESPTGPNAGGADMSASIASLPPMPSRSVPGTPGAPLNSAGNLGGLSSFRKNGPPTAGIAGGQALEGLSASQRGFSNPDLAKAFQKVGPGFGSIAAGPRVSRVSRLDGETGISR